MAIATAIRPVRVCHVCEETVETPFFQYIAQTHDRDRFPVTIGSIRENSAFQTAMRAAGVPSFGLGATARRQYARTILALARLVRRERVDIVHSHGFDATFVGLLGCRLARVPFVFTRHHSDHNIRLGARWHTRIDSWCARHAGHVIAVSKDTRRILMEVEGVPGDRITVVYNGVTPLSVSPPERLARLRKDLNLDGAPVCLVIGRLHEEKGHRFLIAALPEIISRIGPVVTLLAGEGPERANIETQARTLGLERLIRVLGWRHDVPDLIALSSVIALPSLAESFGQALTEAMALGKPVVACITGGVPEVVAHDETGLLVPQENPGALADAVCAVLGDPARARAFGEAGRKRAALFTYERMLRGYEAVYDAVLDRQAP